ncbi:MAG: hypothetical protein HYS87_02590 [Candidatus Colwellbacteria bacterium]|nr:hypothetical protein [Candidatus Colwellbacteria bacterium]
MTNRGVVSLPVVIVLAFITLAVGIAVTAIGFGEVSVSAEDVGASVALTYAEAGAREALRKISVSPFDTFATTTDDFHIAFQDNGCDTDPGADCVRVTMEDTAANTIEIISKGEHTVGGRANVRTVKVTVTQYASADDSYVEEIISNAVWEDF